MMDPGVAAMGQEDDLVEVEAVQAEEKSRLLRMLLGATR